MSPPLDDLGDFGVSAIRVDRVGVGFDAFIGGSSFNDRPPTGRIERIGVVVVVVVVVTVATSASSSASRVPSSARARASVASAFRDVSSLDAVVSTSLSLFAPIASSLAGVVARSFGVSSSLALTSYASRKCTSIGVASNPLETRAFAPFGVFTGGRNDEDDAIDRARDDEASAPSVSVARTSDE